MNVNALTVGILVAGAVVVVALFRFRHVLTKFSFGKAVFSLLAKKERPQATGKTKVGVGDVQESEVDIVAGSRGSSKGQESKGHVEVKVGNVKKSQLNITGEDDLSGS